MDQATEGSLYRPKPSDLVAFLPFACCQLETPFVLRILVETIEEYVSKSAADDKGKKSKREKTPQVQPSTVQYSVEKEQSAVEQEYSEESEVILRVRCDSQGRPVELLFHRCPEVPRLLMKILSLCIPYHEQLARISVRWSLFDGAALYELTKFLPLSQLTEIFLDDSPVPQRNYHILLERPSRLRALRLARCDLTDEDCIALAALLGHPLPAASTLASLSLKSNRIGDEGARALGAALRTNRALRHLNLAGNVITSLGAAHIFRSLMQFPLLRDEIVSKRKRTFELLKLRNDAFNRCYRELLTSSEIAADTPRGRTRSSRTRKMSVAPPAATKSSGVPGLVSRAEALAAELVGARLDPYEPTELVVRDGITCCAGNYSLSYLNLAFNELDCTSARRLCEVLAYQAETERPPGLLRVVLEGNSLPSGCNDARAAEELLERLLANAEGQGGTQIPPKSNRKSERPKFK